MLCMGLLLSSEIHGNESYNSESCYGSIQTVLCSHSEGGLKRAYGLCQRMMHFFHQYLLHVTFEVLEPHWLTLLKDLKAATTLDEVIHPFPLKPYQNPFLRLIPVGRLSFETQMQTPHRQVNVCKIPSLVYMVPPLPPPPLSPHPPTHNPYPRLAFLSLSLVHQYC